jgi:hypothetical protein
MKISLNGITQILSWVLLAFTFSGLDVNPDTVANTIVSYLTNEQFFALISYVVLNLANVFIHWIKQLKTDPGKFWSFFESVNFWVAGSNIVLGLVLLNLGIEIDPVAVKTFIELIFSREYWEAGTMLLVNIILPVLKTLISKKQRKP